MVREGKDTGGKGRLHSWGISLGKEGKRKKLLLGGISGGGDSVEIYYKQPSTGGISIKRKERRSSGGRRVGFLNDRKDYKSRGVNLGIERRGSHPSRKGNVNCTREIRLPGGVHRDKRVAKTATFSPMSFSAGGVVEQRYPRCGRKKKFVKKKSWWIH